MRNFIIWCQLWWSLWTKAVVFPSTRLPLEKPLILLQQGLKVWPAQSLFWFSRGSLPSTEPNTAWAPFAAQCRCWLPARDRWREERLNSFPSGPVALWPWRGCMSCAEGQIIGPCAAYQVLLCLGCVYMSLGFISWRPSTELGGQA